MLPLKGFFSYMEILVGVFMLKILLYIIVVQGCANIIVILSTCGLEGAVSFVVRAFFSYFVLKGHIIVRFISRSGKKYIDLNLLIY